MYTFLQRHFCAFSLPTLCSLVSLKQWTTEQPCSIFSKRYLLFYVLKNYLYCTNKVNSKDKYMYWNNFKSCEGWGDTSVGELPFTQAWLSAYPCTHRKKKKHLQYCTSVAPVNNGGHTGQPIYPKLWEPGSMKHSVSRNKKKMD